MIISQDVRQSLAGLAGKLTENEGLKLAELASHVPLDLAIVEVGSYCGKSACYLGVGSRHGHHASVYAVDLWDLHSWDGYSAPDVFETWKKQVGELDLHGIVSSIRCDSAAMGQLFSRPIGLLFIDANHTYEAVRNDFFSWSDKVVPGGVVAFHDYVNPKFGAGVKQFVDEHIRDNNDWETGDIVDSMYVTRRCGPIDLPNSRLTFVDNEILNEHLQRRPPQYGLDLAAVVPTRDQHGIYVDTHSAEYRALKEKYSVCTPLPLLERIRKVCATCPVGASCNFPEMTVIRQQEFLDSNAFDQQHRLCGTQAWGGSVDVVYPYIEGPAQGDELRYSIRSVLKHFVGRARIWVVGDKPDWYVGNYLPHKRLTKGPHCPRFDRAAKLKLIVKHRKITDEFVWMMDDVYFLNKVMLHDLRIRWRCSNMDIEKLQVFSPKNVWEREKLLTWRALSDAGRPVADLASHVPVVYEKQKVKNLFRKYPLTKQPLVDDLLYLNEYAEQVPRPANQIRYIARDDPSVQQILSHAQQALIMNHRENGYTPAMREALEQLFPIPSEYEKSATL